MSDEILEVKNSAYKINGPILNRFFQQVAAVLTAIIRLYMAIIIIGSGSHDSSSSDGGSSASYYTYNDGSTPAPSLK